MNNRYDSDMRANFHNFDRGIINEERERDELRKKINSGRGSQFDHQLLRVINDYPGISMYEAWDMTETHFANLTRTTKRKNPYSPR